MGPRGRLAGKVCAITGAASGIGRESALRFASEGAVVACVDIAEDAGRAVADEIVRRGGTAEFLCADVADEGSVAALYGAVVNRFGAVHVLMNNAGIMLAEDGSVLDTELATWGRVIDVNLTSVFLCCKHGIPKLLESGGGSIVNTASFVALLGAATSQIAYTASKGGVLALTREIAVEFARRGIRANALCPGPIETPLLAELFSAPGARERRLVHIPAGRFGATRDIANAALFLASDEASWVTGSTFVVDGGITAAYVTPE